MNITFLFALIGAITGLSGLLLHFFDYWKTRPNLIIDVDMNYSIYFDSADVIKPKIDDTFKNSTRGAFITCSIKNASIYPITIENIQVSQNDKIFVVEDFSERFIHYIDKNSNAHFEREFPKMLSTHFRLETYDSKRGNLKTLFLNYAEIKDGTLNLTITIFTPRKNFIKKVALSKFNPSH